MMGFGIDFEKYRTNGWISSENLAPLIFFDYKYNGDRAHVVSRDCPPEIIEEMRKINDLLIKRFSYTPRFFLPDMNGYEQAVAWCERQKQRRQH